MRSSYLLVLVLVAMCFAMVAAKSELNSRPIIGVFSLAKSDDPHETESRIPAAYVKWLEQAAARVAVVPFNAPKKDLDALFDSINGLLFTGGGLSLNQTTVYWQNALYLWNKAKEANDKGDIFPIWGTCQGFQLMHLLAAQPEDHEDVLKCNIYDSENLPLPLDFTSSAPTSQMFSGAVNIPAFVDGSSKLTIYEATATQNLTMNLHNCGVSPEDFYRNPILPSFYNVISTNVDRKGLPFISTVEGIKYPFWAAQWHAERTQFEWDLAELLAHNAQGAALSSYISQRFMFLARQSQHKFPNPEAEKKALIYMYVPIFTGEPETAIGSEQTYEFRFHYDN